MAITKFTTDTSPAILAEKAAEFFNKRYGTLTVIGYKGLLRQPDGCRKHIYTFKCDCGKIFDGRIIDAMQGELNCCTDCAITRAKEVMSGNITDIADPVVQSLGKIVTAHRAEAQKTVELRSHRQPPASTTEAKGVQVTEMTVAELKQKLEVDVFDTKTDSLQVVLGATNFSKSMAKSILYKQYGELESESFGVIIKEAKKYVMYIKCRCSCGKTCLVAKSDLESGRITSCGQCAVVPVLKTEEKEASGVVTMHMPKTFSLKPTLQTAQSNNSEAQQTKETTKPSADSPTVVSATEQADMQAQKQEKGEKRVRQRRIVPKKVTKGAEYVGQTICDYEVLEDLGMIQKSHQTKAYHYFKVQCIHCGSLLEVTIAHLRDNKGHCMNCAPMSGREKQMKAHLTDSKVVKADKKATAVKEPAKADAVQAETKPVAKENAEQAQPVDVSLLAMVSDVSLTSEQSSDKLTVKDSFGIDVTATLDNLIKYFVVNNTLGELSFCDSDHKDGTLIFQNSSLADFIEKYNRVCNTFNDDIVLRDLFLQAMISMFLGENSEKNTDNV